MFGANISLGLLCLVWPIAYAASGSSIKDKVVKSTANSGGQFSTQSQDYESVLDGKTNSQQLVDELVSELISVYKSALTDEKLSVLRDDIEADDGPILLDGDLKSLVKPGSIQSHQQHESAMNDLNLKFTMETMEELLLELIEDYSISTNDEVLNAMARKLRLLSLINREALNTAINGDIKSIRSFADNVDEDSYPVDEDSYPYDTPCGRLFSCDVDYNVDEDSHDRLERHAEPEPNEYEFDRFEREADRFDREAAPEGYASGYADRSDEAPEDFEGESDYFDAEAEPEAYPYQFDRVEGEAEPEFNDESSYFKRH